LHIELLFRKVKQHKVLFVIITNTDNDFKRHPKLENREPYGILGAKVV